LRLARANINSGSTVPSRLNVELGVVQLVREVAA